MKTIFPTLPSGYTIFCDDIRHEKSGKRTLVGTYGSHLLVNELPCLLAKICLVVVLREDPNARSATTVKILFQAADLEDDEHTNAGTTVPDIGVVIAEQEVRAPDQKGRPKHKGFLMSESHLEFQISPFQIENPGILKVRAYRDDLEVRLGAIVIGKIENADLDS